MSLQQTMGDMRSVILAYKAVCTDSYISKPMKAKECILRMYTHLCVSHCDHKANSLKQTHCFKEKGKSRHKIEAEHM